MVRSLIDIYRHEGKLPDCRMSLCQGFTQGGSNADNLLADSYLKGLRDGIDWETGYEAVISDAEEQSEIWTVQGRGGLDSWKTLGYIPTDDFDPHGVGLFTRSISRTIEYSYNDFCIAEMALEMNKTDDAEKYLERSGNWVNMFDPDSRSLLNLTGSSDPAALVDSGFQGFLQPRYANGTFGYQDPSICTFLYNFTSCYLNANGHETYEGGAWLYTFYVPHNQAGLIPMLGGPRSSLVDYSISMIPRVSSTLEMSSPISSSSYSTLQAGQDCPRKRRTSIYRVVSMTPLAASLETMTQEPWGALLLLP
uniref:Glycosyl hydrolase family 92 domain-containing protein n=1 Tax=Bionectria ochroleuca TaxID=29856 RepID=A0A8H7NKW2_BIOOC